MHGGGVGAGGNRTFCFAGVQMGHATAWPCQPIMTILIFCLVAVWIGCTMRCCAVVGHAWGRCGSGWQSGVLFCRGANGLSQLALNCDLLGLRMLNAHDGVSNCTPMHPIAMVGRTGGRGAKDSLQIGCRQSFPAAEKSKPRGKISSVCGQFRRLAAACRRRLQYFLCLE